MQIRRPTHYDWLWSSTTRGSLAEGVSLSVLSVLSVLMRSQVAAALAWLAFGLPEGALADIRDQHLEPAEL